MKFQAPVIPLSVPALPDSAGSGGVLRLAGDGELYEDAPGGWRKLRGSAAGGGGGLNACATVSAGTGSGTSFDLPVVTLPAPGYYDVSGGWVFNQTAAAAGSVGFGSLVTAGGPADRAVVASMTAGGGTTNTIFALRAGGTAYWDATGVFTLELDVSYGTGTISAGAVQRPPVYLFKTEVYQTGVSSAPSFGIYITKPAGNTYTAYGHLRVQQSDAPGGAGGGAAGDSYLDGGNASTATWVVSVDGGGA